VLAYAEQRPDRAAEITSQVGFPTAYFAAVAGMNPARNPKTLELIALAQQVAGTVAQRVKHALAVTRPDRVSAQVQPIIPTPGHGALPSGHATEAFVVARLLAHLTAGRAVPPDLPMHLLALAHRIAVNRTVAGVHFPVDSYAGAAIGMTLGDYLAARAGAAVQVRQTSFSGTGVGNRDFLLHLLLEGTDLADVATPGGSPLIARGAELGPVAAAPILGWLWDEARGEW